MVEFTTFLNDKTKRDRDMKKKAVSQPLNNLVAKHMNTFNRSATMVDRKKESKKQGYSKSKNLDAY